MAVSTSRKRAIWTKPCAIRASHRETTRSRGSRRARSRRSARRARRRSYPVERLDRQVEDREGDDGQCDGDEIHVFMLRQTPSRPHEQTPPAHTDFVKVL